jgi:DNA-dependent RNA polymerase auxiliary subunit epsilon
MKRFGSFILFTSLILLLILSALDLFYTYCLTRGPLYKIPSGRHYRYLVIGDSRTSSILEDKLDTLTGSSTINITNYGANLDDVPELLDHFYFKGNSAETVLLSVDLRTGTKYGVAKDWMYYPHKLRRHDFLEPRIPFIYYAERNNKLPWRKVTQGLFSEVDSVREDDRDLSIAQTYKVYDDIPDYSRESFRIGIIDSIRTMLRQHGATDLRLFIAPLSDHFNRSQRDSTSYKKLIRDRGYVLYDHSTLFRDTSYFADDLHIRRKYYDTFTVVFARDLLTKKEGSN